MDRASMLNQMLLSKSKKFSDRACLLERLCVELKPRSSADSLLPSSCGCIIAVLQISGTEVTDLKMDILGATIATEANISHEDAAKQIW